MLKMHNKTKLIINTTKNNTMELFKQYLLNKILIVQLMSNLLRISRQIQVPLCQSINVWNRFLYKIVKCINILKKEMLKFILRLTVK